MGGPDGHQTERQREREREKEVSTQVCQDGGDFGKVIFSPLFDF
jgi:hypothetical protein